MPEYPDTRIWDVGHFELARVMQPGAVMPAPLMIVPGSFYLISRRCALRMFLLKPDPITNNAFTYCLAVAAERFGIVVVLPSMMSNHHHTLVYDPIGNLPAFCHYFHWLLARVLNARWDRSENFWSSAKPSYVKLLSASALIKKLVYAAVNPVKANLVSKVAEWPGVNGLANLLSGEPLVAHRPKFFLNQDAETEMPERVSLKLEIPSTMGARDHILKTVRAAVAKVEEKMAAQRARAGTTVVGVSRVLQRQWFESAGIPRRAPVTERTKFSPRFAGSRRVIAVAVMEYREFRSDYSVALACKRAKTPIPFPFGTYYLWRLGHVSVVGGTEPPTAGSVSAANTASANPAIPATHTTQVQPPPELPTSQAAPPSPSSTC